MFNMVIKNDIVVKILIIYYMVIKEIYFVLNNKVYEFIFYNIVIFFL